MTIRVKLIYVSFILASSCKSRSSNSELRDVGVKDELRYENAVVFSGVEGQVPYVFFKKCPLDEPANRTCGTGASSYEKKLNLREQYEPALAQSDRDKILSCLRSGFELIWSVENDAPLPPTGSSRGCTLTKAQVQATFAPFGWPVAAGTTTGGGGSPVPQDMRFIPIAGTNFEMQETEVTRGQWKSVMGKYPEDPPALEGLERPCTLLDFRATVRQENHPVSCVSWNEAMEFANKMTSTNEGTYRLPTIEEWTKAAGDIAGNTYGWCEKTSTQAVRSLTPYNGLYDMVGNVYEWTLDRHSSDSASNKASRYVIGGSWRRSMIECTSNENRKLLLYTNAQFKELGFRLVKVPK